MGELNLDKIERNYRDETGMELFRLTPEKQKPVRLADWRTPAGKDRISLSEDKTGVSSVIRL
jgi:hypothetical protein